MPVMSRMAWLGDQRGPGSISHDLFWWHEGRFVHLPQREAERDGIADESRIGLTPPDEFIQLLNALASEAKSAGTDKR
jgi:hypothetical protein